MENQMEQPGTTSPFTEGYYLRGERSNYVDYRWLPEQTLPMAAAIKNLLGMQDDARVLDVGCARGYLVKAFRMLRLDAWGQDISEWAIANCHPDVEGYVGTSYETGPMSYDYIVAKDVFEHIPPDELERVVADLVSMMRVSMLVVVPLTRVDGLSYICPKDEIDTTHVNRWTLPTWISFLEQIDRRLVVSGGFYVPGIKQANTAWEQSCGFITLRRL